MSLESEEGSDDEPPRTKNSISLSTETPVLLNDKILQDIDAATKLMNPTKVTHSNVTGFVLAGGKSSRMGQDKAFLQFRRTSLIDYPIQLLRALTCDVRIIGAPSKYASLGLSVVPDCVESVGPASGIYTALKASPTALALVLACDMPLMRVEFLNLLLTKAPQADAVMMRFEDGWIEPLCATFSTNCLQALEKNLKQRKLKISDFLDLVRVSYISENEIQMLGLSSEIFANVNTPEEFERLVSRKGY